MVKNSEPETRGRKPLRTPGGERIRKVICNMTIPQYLYDYLVENKISRSKLFTEMAKELYKEKVNPCCFKEGRRGNDSRRILYQLFGRPPIGIPG